MKLFNLLIAISGFIGWAWIWTRAAYKTDKTWQTQISIILFGFGWLSLILADTVQGLEPTTGSIFARLILFVACALMTPLLKRKG